LGKKPDFSALDVFKDKSKGVFVSESPQNLDNYGNIGNHSG
jgi:hypothetical protein